MRVEDFRENDKNGITLIVLVITIIILIILAGVTTSYIAGKGGIIEKANVSVNKYSFEQAREKLEVELANLYADAVKNGEEVNVKLCLKLKNEEEIEKIILIGSKIASAEIIGENIENPEFALITYYGYVFKIDNRLQIVDYIGFASDDKEAPNCTIDFIPIDFGYKAVINSTDNGGSGLNYECCKYTLTSNSEPIGTNLLDYKDGNINEENEVIEKNCTPGTYYLHVLLSDIAGNRREIISDNEITITKMSKNFDEGIQKISLIPGTYKIECWGAQGGTSNGGTGGNGSYTCGNITLTENQDLYVCVGSMGGNATTSSGGYNGGGYSSTGNLPAGGGATDIRTVYKDNIYSVDSLLSRIMVAAAGSGGNIYNGAPGGNLNGLKTNSNFNGTLATQTSAGTNGTFGKTSITNGYTGAGGGYYTGGTSTYTKTTTIAERYIGREGETVNLNGTYKIKYGANGNWAYKVCSGSVSLSNSVFGDPCYGTVKYGYIVGETTTVSYNISTSGSSFISGHEGCNAVSKDSTENNIIHTGSSEHFSGLKFTNTIMSAGNEEMPTHDGTNKMIGNSGNGFARITYINDKEEE